MNRSAAEARGRKAERRTAWWLRLHGWRIVARRVRCSAGEVDIIARRGRMIAFVEVKTRRTSADLDTAIDAYRLRRVVAATHALAPRFARAGEDIRIDILLIAPFAWPRHVQNVWHG